MPYEQHEYQTRLTTDGGDIVVTGATAARGKIPTFDEPQHAEAAHPLMMGTISDSVATREALTPFYDALHTEASAIGETLNKLDNDKSLNQYRKEVADQKRAEAIMEHIDVIDGIIAEQTEKAQEGAQHARNFMNAAIEIVEPKTEIAQLMQEMRMQEVRRQMLDLDAKGRDAYMANIMQAKDLFSLQALDRLPVNIFPSTPDYVLRARVSIATEKHPFLGKMSDYHHDIKYAVNVRTNEFRMELQHSLTKRDYDLTKMRKIVAKRA